MRVKGRKLLIKITLWLMSEIIFNLAGIDDLVDYSEFVFEQNLADRERQIILIEDSIMATRRKSKFGKRKLPDPQEVLAKSQKNNVLQFFTHPNAPQQKSVSSKSIRGKFDICVDEQLCKRQFIFQSAKTVIPQILPWVILCSGYGFFVSLLDYWGLLPEIIGTQAIANTVVGLTLTLGLLLIFKFNIALDRFRSGLKLWKATIDVACNMVRGICLYVNDREPQESYEKESAIRLVSAFAVAMKLHLRQKPMTELKPLISQLEYKRLQVSYHAPLDITFWFSDYLQCWHEREQLNTLQLFFLRNCIEEMTNILGQCDRIVKTPQLSALNITSKVLFTVYSIVLPLGLIGGLGWKTALVATLVSFVYLFINEVATEVGKPFNNSHSDLYLDFVGDAVKQNAKDLMQRTSRLSQPRPVIDLPKKAA